MKEELKILVVDDEEMLRNLLARILEREGYAVSTASGGKQALAFLEKSNFQIMISDVKMPEMTGFELLKEVKGKYPRLAVVMMTAFGDENTVEQALGLGADGYVAKPFKSHNLTSEVQRARQKAASQPAPKKSS
ncbi:MAG: response regulator [candidate division Zixibacteria bacterium]|nr:response regulator [candidate division Zixibacteria bacterium]